MRAIRFFVADRGRVQSRGLELAFQDARTKAETVARLSHKALGDVVCVSEGPSWMAADFTNGRRRCDRAASVRTPDDAREPTAQAFTFRQAFPAPGDTSVKASEVDAEFCVRPA